MRINIPTTQTGWFFGIHGRELSKLFPEYEFIYDRYFKEKCDGVYSVDVNVDIQNQNTILHLFSVISYVQLMRPKIVIPTNQEDWAYGFHVKDLREALPEYEFVFEADPAYGKYGGVYHLNCIYPAQNYPPEKRIANLRSTIQYEFLRRNKKLGDEGLAWWLNSKFKKVYACSHEIVTDLVWLRNDIKYMPQGINTDRFRPKVTKNKKFVVGWAGTDRYIKRFPTLMRALGELEDVEFRYCLYNHPSFRTWDEMPDFYQGLDAYINISTTEGGNRCVFEAMSCGVPVIATPVGEAYQSVLTGTTGLLLHLNGNAVQGVRDAVYLMREIINDDMKRNAREYIMQHYDWNKIKHLYKEMFEDLLSETSNN